MGSTDCRLLSKTMLWGPLEFCVGPSGVLCGALWSPVYGPPGDHGALVCVALWTPLSPTRHHGHLDSLQNLIIYSRGKSGHQSGCIVWQVCVNLRTGEQNYNSSHICLFV